MSLVILLFSALLSLAVPAPPGGGSHVVTPFDNIGGGPMVHPADAVSGDPRLVPSR